MTAQDEWIVDDPDTTWMPGYGYGHLIVGSTITTVNADGSESKHKITGWEWANWGLTSNCNLSRRKIMKNDTPDKLNELNIQGLEGGQLKVNGTWYRYSTTYKEWLYFPDFARNILKKLDEMEWFAVIISLLLVVLIGILVFAAMQNPEAFSDCNVKTIFVGTKPTQVIDCTGGV